MPLAVASPIPYLGTRAGTFGAPDESPRKALLGLVFLALVVVVLGNDTVAGSDAPIPEALAFSESLASQPPAESALERPWSDAEVLGRYGPSFVDVVLVQCNGSVVAQETTTLGLAVHEHNVVYLPVVAFEPDVIWIPGRAAGGVPALTNGHPSGVSVATTEARLTRNLELGPDPAGDPHLHLAGSRFSGVELVAESDVGAAGSIVVSVSTTGEVLGVHVGHERLPQSTLWDISANHAVTGGELPERATVCDRGAALSVAQASQPFDDVGPR